MPSRLSDRICAPTPALPVDAFRILVGFLSSAYFFHLYAQVADFSSPDGLIDHELTRQLFWYTRIALFGPLMTADAFRLVFLFAAIASWGLVVGYRVKAISAVLFLIAVSAYRWNFLVIYVDDAIMHLVLFWLILLPVGHTLVLAEWQRDGRAAVERWKREVVPGGPVRCFLVNLALVYLVAGLWKWTSPMWRDGSALYAALRMPIAYAPDFWQPAQFPILRLANYGAMVLEPLLPLMLVLPVRSRLKWGLFAGCVAFHLGIIATMMIPYANLACLAAAPIIFRHEIMEWLGQDRFLTHPAGEPATMCWRTRSALAFVTVLVFAMAGEARVPSWRTPSRHESRSATRDLPTRVPHVALISSVVFGDATTTDGRVGFLRTEHNIFYVPLWFVGIAQSYRLFDWIDDRNFHTHYEITERLPAGGTRRLDPEELFPSTLRSVLLQGYMHGITWGRVPRNRATEFRAGLSRRFANRFCASHRDTGLIEVLSQIERIHPHGVASATSPEMLMLFDCKAGKAELRLPHTTDAPALAAQ